MAAYIAEDLNCRSRFIAAYFGESHVKPCGICDNCLKQKATELSKEEFDELYQQIISLVHEKPVPARELLLQLGSVKKEKAWKVLNFLQAENKIGVDATGRVYLK